MAIAADRAGIQFRMLNASKGPAVRATRAQADRALYRNAIRALLEAQPEPHAVRSRGRRPRGRSNGRAEGVVTMDGATITCARGRADRRHVSRRAHPRRPREPRGRSRRRHAFECAGRATARAAVRGRSPEDRHAAAPRRTHARLRRHAPRSPATSRGPCSRSSAAARTIRRRCIATSRRRTRARTRSSAARPTARRCSPASSRASARATARRSRTRSCASPTKASHQIFVEPEGLDTHVVYPNGISTSLPADVQLEFVRSIARLRARRDDASRLRDRVRLLLPTRPARLARDEAARRALLRRPDQRHDRLRGGGGAGPARRHQRGAARVRTRALVAAARRGLPRRDGGRPHHPRRDGAVSHVHQPRRAPAAAARGQRRRAPHAGRTRDGPRRRRALGILRAKRNAIAAGGAPAGADARLAEQVQRGLEAREKYAGYIGRQQAEVERQRRNEETRLPAEIDYAQVAGLSNEARQRLVESRPGTLGQASRLPGITAATISVLLVHLKKCARAA